MKKKPKTLFFVLLTLGIYSNSFAQSTHFEIPARNPATQNTSPANTGPQPKLVSISITQDLPLKDALETIGRLANVKISVSNNVTGGANYTARDKPFNQVIKEICAQNGLTYSMQGNVLHISRR